MNIEEVREYCISKKGIEETFPFDEVTLVFKVMGKMYALLSLDKSTSINLKCNPERAIQLREKYDAIVPGFHMNKKHWNTVDYKSNLPDTLVKELIDHSYDLVVSSLTKKLKKELEELE
jgi:predicted DNA-binding protein (MmcQ/YjbR family)